MLRELEALQDALIRATLTHHEPEVPVMTEAERNDAIVATMPNTWR